MKRIKQCCAIAAMNVLNGRTFTDGSQIEISLSKPPSDKRKKKYKTHQSAAKAKRRVESGRFHIWSNEMFVDKADGQEEPDEIIMSMVKVLYVRNF